MWPSFALQGKITLERGAVCLAFASFPHYLICAPVPHGNDAQAKDEPWPRQVPGGVPEDVEGVAAGGVALGIHLSAPIGGVGWNSCHVFLHESLIPSYFSKC